MRDMGRLRAPSDALHRAVVTAYVITETQVRSALLSRGVGQKLRLCVADTPAYKALRDALCPEHRLDSMIARFVRMQIHLACARVTALSGKGVNKANRKQMKLSSRVE